MTKPSELYGRGAGTLTSMSPRTAALLAEADRIHEDRMHRLVRESDAEALALPPIPARIPRDCEQPPSLPNHGMRLLHLSTAVSFLAGFPCVIAFTPPWWVTLPVLFLIVALAVACVCDSLERV